MTCNACKFWHDISLGHRLQGECRRFAPTAAARLQHAFWPITPAEAWCGEFRDGRQPQKVDHAPGLGTSCWEP